MKLFADDQCAFIEKKKSTNVADADLIICTAQQYGAIIAILFFSITRCSSLHSQSQTEPDGDRFKIVIPYAGHSVTCKDKRCIKFLTTFDFKLPGRI